MRCDARKLEGPDGGFTCSVLGDTVGANWLWEQSPFQEKLKECQKCNANIVYKQTLLGVKVTFSCWVMGEFKVKKNVEQLQSKIDQYTYRDKIAISIPEEKFKISLIGRDGNNIKAFNEMTGVKLIIDDTMKKVFLAGGDENKVATAKLVLEHMVRENHCSKDKIAELVKLYS